MLGCTVSPKGDSMKQRLSPEENRRAWLLAALIVLAMLTLCALGLLLFVRIGQTADASLPQASAELRAAAKELDRITIDASFDPDRSVLTGTQELLLTNRTGQDHSYAVLRSYSGAYLSEDTSPMATEEMFLSCYGDMFVSGGLRLKSAQVDGQSILTRWADSTQTVLFVPAAWKAGETIRVTLNWEIIIPDCASRFGVQSDIWAIGNAFPTPAVWENGAWRTEEVTAIGDPFLSECLNWSVHLTLPAAYQAAASAYAEPVVSGTMARYDFEALASRDFALVISDRFTRLQRMAGDTLLTAFAQSESAAVTMLDSAEKALGSFASRWGNYVYPALTLTEVDFPFGGMEYPGLVMIASDALRSGGESLANAVAHETAHQWWAVQTGSDSWYQPWQDESLCEYAMLCYIGDHAGLSARENAEYHRIETALRITTASTVTPGCPLDYFSDFSEYSTMVYRRGAALWLALENFMGEEKLHAALKDYQERYRFAIASREDLTAVLSEHAGMDLSPLMADYLDTEMN